MRISLFSAVVLGSAFSAFAQTPAVSAGGVVNGASFTAGQVVAPGSLISIFGSNLGSGTAQADTVPLSTTLGGVSVSFNNVAAPLNLVVGGASSQVNAQLPWNVLPAGTTSGTVNVVVTAGGVASAPVAVQVGPASPGVFAVNFGAGAAIAINTDGTLAAAAGSISGLTTHAAKAGDTIVLLCTGLGAVTPTIASGANSTDTLRTAVNTPQVMVGGQSATVAFAGLSPQFVGVNQINFTVPSGVTGNTLPLQLVQGGITTTNQVTIAVGS